MSKIRNLVSNAKYIICAYSFLNLVTIIYCIYSATLKAIPWLALMACIPWVTLCIVTIYSKRTISTFTKIDYSKQMITDIRYLLWVVTIGGLLLAVYCIYRGFTGSLPWVSAMVGLPWTAHGTVCSFYLNMAKSDHQTGGTTFETAKAKNFSQDFVGSDDSPAI